MQTHEGNVFIHVGVSQRCRARDEEPTPEILHAESKHTKRSSGTLEVRSLKVQKPSSHISFIVKDVTAVEVGCTTEKHVEPSARLHAESEHA